MKPKVFLKKKVKAVEYAVKNHVGWVKQNLETLEAKILWDADKISHTGPSILFADIFMLTSKNLCEVFFKLKYEPTVTLDNVMPALMRMKCEIDYNEPNPFHLEESKKISNEKAEALNSFLDALQRRL